MTMWHAEMKRQDSIALADRGAPVAARHRVKTIRITTRRRLGQGCSRAVGVAQFPMITRELVAPNE